MPYTCEEKCFIGFISQYKGWGIKRICKIFFIKKWAASSVEKTNSTERKTGNERPRTVGTEQNRKHVAELMSSQKKTLGSSRSPR